MYHLCLSVRGALHNWRDRDMKRCFSHDDGRVMTVREAKNFLMDEIAKGHDVIPTCECDNFDYKKGCLGHSDEADTPNSSNASDGSQDASPEAKKA